VFLVTAVTLYSSWYLSKHFSDHLRSCLPAASLLQIRHDGGDSSASWLHRQKFDKKESEPPAYTATTLPEGTVQFRWDSETRLASFSTTTAHAAIITPTQKRLYFLPHTLNSTQPGEDSVLYILLFSHRETGACREMCTGAKKTAFTKRPFSRNRSRIGPISFVTLSPSNCEITLEFIFSSLDTYAVPI
jgi:hypothetical protein